MSRGIQYQSQSGKFCYKIVLKKYNRPEDKVRFSLMTEKDRVRTIYSSVLVRYRKMKGVFKNAIKT